MNMPDFNKYGLLGYLQFKVKSRKFSYVNYDSPSVLGVSKNASIKEAVHSRVFSLLNTGLTNEVISARKQKLDEIANYSNAIKAHPLTEFELDGHLTSIGEVSQLVLEETSKVLLPTVTTKLLIKELCKRFLRKIKNGN